MITKSQIHETQKKWGDGIVKIGALKDNESECLEFTSSFLNSLYDFENNDVLFKPTRAADEQFRPTFQMALSYFLGGSNSYCMEDEGFAMKPWLDVKFVNSGFIIENERAIAMGNYFFTDVNGDITKVEYSFVYKRIGDTVKIVLHHSSLPYNSN